MQRHTLCYFYSQDRLLCNPSYTWIHYVAQTGPLHQQLGLRSQVWTARPGKTFIFPSFLPFFLPPFLASFLPTCLPCFALLWCLQLNLGHHTHIRNLSITKRIPISHNWDFPSSGHFKLVTVGLCLGVFLSIGISENSLFYVH